MGWAEFVAVYVLFFLLHSLPVRPPLRPWLQARLGPGGFTLGYSGLSLIMLAWLIVAAGRAPHVPLWVWAPWQVYVPLFAMLPACLIVALSIARPNPVSFGGARNERFDPMRPGIVRLTRHPLLLALALWAAAHVVPNGDLAHVVLFGTFAVFAMFSGGLIDRRKQREMGEDWHRLQKAVASAPWRDGSRPVAVVLRLAMGLGVYLLLIWLHSVVFGVSPLP